MYKKVKEVSNLAGVSVRTLHHYDDIGLFHPAELSDAGYRLYSNEDLETLQHILFFKELGFSLRRIKEILHDPAFDRKEALELHRKYLLKKRERLDKMIHTVEKAIRESKGDIHMTNEEKFKGFDFSKNPYEQEARERWGNKAVDESNSRISSISESEQEQLAARSDEIYTNLASIRHLPPDSEQAQDTIGKWYAFISHFGTYSPEAFKGLGQMYVDDERFTRNIDKYGEGLAIFMRDSMAYYADRKKE